MTLDELLAIADRAAAEPNGAARSIDWDVAGLELARRLRLAVEGLRAVTREWGCSGQDDKVWFQKVMETLRKIEEGQ